MSYAAPVRELSFVLNSLVGLSDIAELEGFGEASPDLVEAILEESARFNSEVLGPLNRQGDQQGSRWEDGSVITPDGWKEAYGQFIENGWGALAFPVDHGGQGLPMCVAVAVQEMWHSSNMSFGLCPMLSQAAVDAIELHGSDEQRKTYLPKLVEGVWGGTMNLTESQAGSDLAAVRTRAEPKGDHYLITGQKIFITYGEHDLTDNIIHLLLARTPDAPPGVKGISLFIVPKFIPDANGEPGERNDLRCVSIEEKLGIHGSPTCVMSFGDDGGAVGYLVGEENNGLVYMFTMMNQARHAVGVEGYAIAERAYQHALAYATDRKQGRTLLGEEQGGDHSIVNHPDVRRMLMSMKSNVEAARALALECAAAFDRARRHPDAEVRERNQRRGELLTPLVKGWSTEMGVEMCSLGVQIHGGMGFIEETGAAQYLRDSRITPIYEGTTAIQANDLIGRKTARDGGKGAAELFDDMAKTLAALRAAGHEGSAAADLAAIAARFEPALAAVRDTTDWMLAQDDARLPAAVSVEYLMQLGRLAGGWMMARQALAAVEKAGEDGADEAWFDARRVLARYYAERFLPLVESSAEVIRSSALSTVALDVAQL
ncbi:MAG: acyl-CoA dehydrogenase [Gammaproteobacteria bacterium]|nr:MAG: acyl-CoA dehydrogenase [Gammaproteobacteria bacterium]